MIVHDSRVGNPAVKVPAKHIIPPEAIIVNKELGTGEFGVVQQGVWTNEEGIRVSTVFYPKPSGFYTWCFLSMTTVIFE